MTFVCQNQLEISECLVEAEGYAWLRRLLMDLQLIGLSLYRVVVVSVRQDLDFAFLQHFCVAKRYGHDGS